MELQRRSLMVFFAGASAATLIGCANSTSSGLSSATDTADTVVNAFMLEVPLVQAAFPSVLSPAQAAMLTNATGNGYLDLAKASVAALKAAITAGASDATGATNLEQVEGYINQGLAMAAPVLTAACGIIPQCSDVQAVYREIVLAVPLIEAFISAVKPASSVAQAKVALTRAAAVPSHGSPLMTPDAAVVALKLRLLRQ